MTGGLNILVSVDGVPGGWFPAASNHTAGIMASKTDSQMDAQTITNLHRSFKHNPFHKAVNHDIMKQVHSVNFLATYPEYYRPTAKQRY